MLVGPNPRFQVGSVPPPLTICEMIDGDFVPLRLELSTLIDNEVIAGERIEWPNMNAATDRCQ